MNRALFITIGLMLLTGCASDKSLENTSHPPPNLSTNVTSDIDVFQDNEKGYLITIPKKLSRRTTFSKGLDGPAFPHFTTSESDLDEMRMTIYSSLPFESSSQELSCSPILTGAPEMEVLPMERGAAAWGRVDYSVVYPSLDHAEDQPPPVCANGTSYAFCSEYQGKTVVVCITQQTDDPAMAENIFRTFRWLP